MRLLITGGAGFIGSAVVRCILKDTDWQVLNLDNLTYAGNLESLTEVARHPRYAFRKLDIVDQPSVHSAFEWFKPHAVMHLAAESHVDRSIDGPLAFLKTNVLGTFNLLEAARSYWKTLGEAEAARFRFHHVSTDEVFGSLGPEGKFTESSLYQPNSPYSATKASSDHLVRAWHHTFGLPVVTTNCSNNFGPFQFPEKLIPLTILNALAGRRLPIYGKGENIRDWLFVEDHVRALILVLTRGRVGEVYNIGGDNERANIEVVEKICEILDELRPRSEPHKELIEFVKDRPGHDQRYAIDSTKIKQELGWQPVETFDSGILKTVRWYLDNADGWCARVLDGSYRMERMGLIN